MQLIIGFVIGFFVANVGFVGVATALDNGIHNIKNVSVKVEDKK